MTLITNNPLLKSASGMLGDTHYYREWRGRLVMCKRPKKRMSLSQRQKETVSRFKLAARYASGQMKDLEAKAAYQERTNFRYHSAYLVALNDYLNPPTVKEIRTIDYRGNAGDSITVDAWDDFVVVKVNVVIINQDGAILEDGYAEPHDNNPALWTYRAIVANPNIQGTKIMVMAFDKPGNKGLAEVVL